jgi:N-acyl-L-homoserine lactone synthetase
MKKKSKPKLGEGKRFAAVKVAAKKSGARNPAAVAAMAGMKKYGKKRMAKMSAAGRKRKGK